MRTIIQALSDTVINQIAAGEVIERPASVVKELVENALDAGATDIRIGIEGGGKSLIKIGDNGCGMGPEDLEMCPLRHTTSKLRSTDDLIRIGTNGFRGEAVASIASISKLRIDSRVEDSEVGNSLLLEGGKLLARETMARPVGTLFSVEELFFNTPVRRTFLGSEALETAKISDTVSRIALAHPDKRFELKQGARELFTGIPGTMRARLAEVLGAGMARQMLEFDHQEDSIRVRGFATGPEEMRGRRNLQFFYLGTRPIFNSVIAKAVQRAYEPYGKSGYPVVVLFVDMEGAEFDVNVHPAKREVRFSNENAVFLAVHHAIRNALMQQDGAPVISLAEYAPVNPVEPPPPPLVQPLPEPLSMGNEISGAPAAQTPVPRYSFIAQSQSLPPIKIASPEPPKWEAQDIFSQPEYGKIVQLSPKLFHKPLEIKPDLREQVSGVRFFQWSKTYVVCEDSKGLLLIDQNAASQRILYERALLALDEGKGFDSQELLFPEILEMTRPDSILLQEHLGKMARLGFHLEPFGGGSWQLRGIPVHLGVGRAESALREFLRQLHEGVLPGDEKGGPREVLAKGFALGSSLQSGVTLGNEEMSALLDQLVLTSDPYMSPFGRPALLRLPLEEIHRRFKNL
jgi:DNA mismatch repair protein MutL